MKEGGREGESKLKGKERTGMNGDERDDKAGGRIILFIWVPPPPFLYSFLNPMHVILLFISTTFFFHGNKFVILTSN